MFVPLRFHNIFGINIENYIKIFRGIEFNCQLKKALVPLCMTSRNFMTLGKIKQALPLKSLNFLRLCYEDDATKCVGIKSLRISDIIITIKLW